MQIEIAAPDQAKMLTGAQHVLSVITDTVIDSPFMYEAATDEVRSITARKKALNEQRLAITRPLDEAKKQVMALFDPALTLLDEADKIIRGKMISYTSEQERLRKIEQARLDAIAAEERRKQQEEAEAARKVAAEAQARADAAAEAGNMQAAAAAMEVAEQSASAAATAEMVAAVIVAPTAVSAAPQVKGVSGAKVWRGEVTDKAALVRYVAAHPEFLDLIEPNTTAINQIAKAMKQACPVEGIRVFQDQQLRVRAA